MAPVHTETERKKKGIKKGPKGRIVRTSKKKRGMKNYRGEL
jgi:hypothetical protein